MSRIKDIVAGLTAMSAMGVFPGMARAQEQDRSPQDAVAVDSILAGATVQLMVDGMSCPFCAYSLEKRLGRLPAVDSIVVRVADGVAYIREQSGQRVAEEKFRREVEKAGFTLREVQRIEQ